MWDQCGISRGLGVWQVKSLFIFFCESYWPYLTASSECRQIVRYDRNTFSRHKL